MPCDAGFSVVILNDKPNPLKDIVPLTFIIAEISAKDSSLVNSEYLHISPFTFDENDILPISPYLLFLSSYYNINNNKNLDVNYSLNKLDIYFYH